MKNNIDSFEKSGFPFGRIMNILLIILGIYYMGHHFYNGNYGFRNYINKQNIINQKHTDAQKIEQQIEGIKNKIEKLQDNNLDSDLLDEEIRKNTGYAKKNEIIFYPN